MPIRSKPWLQRTGEIRGEPVVRHALIIDNNVIVSRAIQNDRPANECT